MGDYEHLRQMKRFYKSHSGPRRSSVTPNVASVIENPDLEETAEELEYEPDSAANSMSQGEKTKLQKRLSQQLERRRSRSDSMQSRNSLLASIRPRSLSNAEQQMSSHNPLGRLSLSSQRNTLATSTISNGPTSETASTHSKRRPSCVSVDVLPFSDDKKTGTESSNYFRETTICQITALPR